MEIYKKLNANKILSVIKKPDFNLFWIVFLISLVGLPMLLVGISYEAMAWSLTLLLIPFCIWFAFCRKQDSFEYADIKFSEGLINLPSYSLIPATSYATTDNLLNYIDDQGKNRVSSIQSSFGRYSQNSQRSSHYIFVPLKSQAAMNTLTYKYESGLL